jgi:hypothetical protein
MLALRAATHIREQYREIVERYLAGENSKKHRLRCHFVHQKHYMNLPATEPKDLTV